MEAPTSPFTARVYSREPRYRSRDLSRSAYQPNQKRDKDKQRTYIREIPEVHPHISRLIIGRSDEVGIES